MQLYNSLTRKKELFVPLYDKKVSLYVCGITPYDTTHLGHAFTYISFDLLVRLLKYNGYTITYTQNVTDINDRDNDLLKRAQEKNLTWQELGNFWTEKFLSDMQALNWIPPTNYIKASESIPWMIDVIEKLLKKHIAYIVNGSVYLDITKKKDFGKLSRFSKEKMLEVAKIFEEDIDNPEKKHALDITLWRAAKQTDAKHIPRFDPLEIAKDLPAMQGSLLTLQAGRPGWHIECSAMAIGTLGERIDIHGGGIDLIYPHHESEIAESEGATGKTPFAKYWLHTGTVLYKGRKMSKSLGNVVMVSDLLKKYSANAIRYMLLSHHYREDWEFFEKEIKDAEKKVAVLLKKMTKEKPIQKRHTDIIENNCNVPALLAAFEKESTISSTWLTLLGFVL